MSNNIIFNVVRNGLTKGSSRILNLSGLTLKVHETGNRYYFLELPLAESVKIDDYLLTHHHLSINDEPVSKLDVKSDIHYTANFCSVNSKQYRLHVYFNNNGTMIAKPFLSELNSDGKYIPVPCEEQAEAFHCLARVNTVDILKQLMAEKNDMLQQCQQEYDRMDVEISNLCKEPLSNKKQILDLIQLQLEKIDQLESFTKFSFYSSDAWQIIGRRNFIVSLKNSLLLSKESVTEHNDNANCSSSSSSQSKPLEKDIKGKAKAKNSEPKPQTTGLEQILNSKESVLGTIENLYDELKRLQKQDDSKMAEALGILYAKLKEQELLILYSNDQVSIAVIQQLKSIMAEIEKFGTGTLMRLLLTNKLEEAKQLNSFYRLVPVIIVAFALHKNNADLLSFLLVNRIADIKMTNLCVEQKEYNSLVDYCFSTNKLDLLMVAIEHQASLLEIDTRSGLPFMAQLLLSQNHPLSPVLKHKNFTDDREICLYKNLKKILMMCVASRQGDQSKIKEIEQLIVICNEKIASAKMDSPERKAATNKVIGELREMLDDDLVDRLLADPDVNALQACIKNKSLSLLANASKTVCATARALQMDRMGEFAKELKKLQFLKPEISFVEMKEATIQQQLMRLKIVDLRIALKDIQDLLIQTPVFFKRSVPRDVKQLISKQTHLIAEIKRLEALTGPGSVQIPSFNLFDRENDIGTVKLSIAEMERLADIERAKLAGKLFHSLFPTLQQQQQQQQPQESLHGAIPDNKL